MKPRIFISTVTKELKTARQLVFNTLVQLGYEPIIQEIFETSSEDIRPMLRRHIDSCSAVLQIVGDAYGIEPTAQDDTFKNISRCWRETPATFLARKQYCDSFARVSYTQYEALYALSKGRKVYYLIVNSNEMRDARVDEVDFALDDSDASRADAEARRKLQTDYQARIQSTEHIHFPVENFDQLNNRVLALKSELNKLRRTFRSWMACVTVGLIGITIGIAWLNGGMHRLVMLTLEGQKRIEEQITASGEETQEMLRGVAETVTDPIVQAEHLRKDIHTRAEAAIRELPDQPGRGLEIAKIEKRRDGALDGVEDAVRFVLEGFKEGANPVYKRAAEEFLKSEKIDEAQAYLEIHRESLLVDARRHASNAKSEVELRNRSLEPLILDAKLLESKLQWESARKRLEQVAELAPDWFEARNSLGELLLNLAHYREAETHLRAAVALSANSVEEGNALCNLACLLHQTDRFQEAESVYRKAWAMMEDVYGTNHQAIATLLNNLGGLYIETNRLTEAIPLLITSLQITESHFGPSHFAVSIKLNNLAGLLIELDHPLEAIVLLRRSLAIIEATKGPEYTEVTPVLSNIAKLLSPMLGKPLLYRALLLDENAFGTKHPRVASRLNSIAGYLQDNGCSEAAEALMRRALAIDELGYGPDHTKIATQLNNLAVLYLSTNRVVEAGALLNRSIFIAESALGADHPVVAERLSNLVLVLRATGRSAEAERFSQRAVVISAKKLGKDHSTTKLLAAQYSQLLLELGKSPEEVTELCMLCMSTEEPLAPVYPFVERLFGLSTNLSEAINTTRDIRALKEGKPAIYLMNLNEQIASCTAPLLVANPRDMLWSAFRALDSGSAVDAVMILKKTLKALESDLNHFSPDVNTDLGYAWTKASGNVHLFAVPSNTKEESRTFPPQDTDLRRKLWENRIHAYKFEMRLLVRTYLSSALRQSGQNKEALNELNGLLSEVENDIGVHCHQLGEIHYQLALCHCQAGDVITAKAFAKAAATCCDDVAEPSSPDLSAEIKSRSTKLLAEIENDSQYKPSFQSASQLDLQKAAEHYQLISDLSNLSVKAPVLPLLDGVLISPSKSMQFLNSVAPVPYQDSQALLETLWDMPLDKPIAQNLEKMVFANDRTEAASGYSQNIHESLLQ